MKSAVFLAIVIAYKVFKNWIMDVVTNYVDILIYSKASFVANAYALIM
jgi:hypothetical protein